VKKYSQDSSRMEYDAVSLDK